MEYSRDIPEDPQPGKIRKERYEMKLCQKPRVNQGVKTIDKHNYG